MADPRFVHFHTADHGEVSIQASHVVMVEDWVIAAEGMRARDAARIALVDGSSVLALHSRAEVVNAVAPKAISRSAVSG